MFQTLLQYNATAIARNQVFFNSSIVKCNKNYCEILVVLLPLIKCGCDTNWCNAITSRL